MSTTCLLCHVTGGHVVGWGFTCARLQTALKRLHDCLTAPDVVVVIVVVIIIIIIISATVITIIISAKWSEWKAEMLFSFSVSVCVSVRSLPVNQIVKQLLQNGYTCSCRFQIWRANSRAQSRACYLKNFSKRGRVARVTSPLKIHMAEVILRTLTSAF